MKSVPSIAGPQTRCSLHGNPLSGENKLVRGPQGALLFTKRSGTPIHIHIISHTPIPMPALPPALALPMTRYTDKDLW